jgi:hypothetical protein
LRYIAAGYNECYTARMKFRALQENLRKALVERIDDGQLTGLRLAQLTGFKQAHISNFLNRKRALSLEGMDKVLTTQRMSVLDLLDPAEINKRASILPRSEDDYENIALTERTAAAHPLIISDQIQHILKFRKGFLKKLRAETDAGRERWERFIALRVDAHEGVSMCPRLQSVATVLVDRHYTSFKAYRKGEANIYAVRVARSCVLTYPKWWTDRCCCARTTGRVRQRFLLWNLAGRPRTILWAGCVTWK